MVWFWGSSQKESVSPGDGGQARSTQSSGAENGERQSGCPVKFGNAGAKDDNSASCPVTQERSLDHPMIFLDPRNNMRAGGESQHPGLGQVKSLSQHRIESSIPREDFTPHHQADTGSSKWVYPSEQMFYNAMKRKGWEPAEDDMRTVVGIHNAVNEQTWREVMEWEKSNHPECGNPRLIRFYGRPKDFSPRARFMGLLGYKMPFDRHDWFIDRCGKKVRYVIDFYNGKPTTSQPVSFYLDVRPALDDFESVRDRMIMSLRPWLGAKSGGTNTNEASK